MKWVLVISFLLAFFTFGCNSDRGPEAVLKSFVNYRFSKSQNKDEILKRTTGTLYARVSEMSDEEVETFLDTSPLKKRRFKINFKNCDIDKCHITYTIAYDKMSDGARTFAVEVKKIAELTVDEGQWKISDVNNVKTFLAGKKEIAP